MKVFFHFSVTGFSNTYVVGPDNSGDALIVDPGNFNAELLTLIESNGYYPRGILLTHGHRSHVQGLKTILKIYDAEIFYNSAEVIGRQATVFRGGETKAIYGFDVTAYDVPGHSPDSLVYQIGDMLFTGDTLFAGSIGSSANSYASALLAESLRNTLFPLPDRTLIFPGHGPPSTIGAEKKTNYALLNAL